MQQQIRIVPPPQVFNITNTVFSLFVVYFIYLFSSEKTGAGWSILAIASKVYLIIVIGGILLFMLLFLASSLAAFSLWLSWFMGRR